MAHPGHASPSPPATRNVVGVSRWTSTTGYVIADAVRITKL